MKTAIYARVSTNDQNCEMQLREFREYVARRGWESAAELHRFRLFRNESQPPGAR